MTARVCLDDVGGVLRSGFAEFCHLTRIHSAVMFALLPYASDGDGDYIDHSAFNVARLAKEIGYEREPVSRALTDLIDAGALVFRGLLNRAGSTPDRPRGRRAFTLPPTWRPLVERFLWHRKAADALAKKEAAAAKAEAETHKRSVAKLQGLAWDAARTAHFQRDPGMFLQDVKLQPLWNELSESALEWAVKTAAARTLQIQFQRFAPAFYPLFRGMLTFVSKEFKYRLLRGLEGEELFRDPNAEAKHQAAVERARSKSPPG